jgi:cell division protein FtsI/penicillin-binding protein 2
MSALDLTGDLTRRRRRRGVLVLVLLLLVGLGVGAWWYLNQPPPPDEAAAAFAEAWDAGDPGQGPVAPSGPAVTESWEAIRAGMAEAPLGVSLVEVAHVGEEGDVVVAELTASWALPGDREWTYEVTAPMRLDDEDGWLVEWSSAVAHPDLEDGGVLRVRRTTPPRADILSADGTPLVTAREVVEVGIQPSRVEDVDDTAAAVREVLELDLDGLEDRIEAADPDHFVPVVTLREEDYLEVEDDIQPIPGTVFRRVEQQLAPSRTFAAATLGRAGPVTAEMIETDPERFHVGDTAGLSGLQRTYDEQLAGRPGLEVEAVPPEGSDAEVVSLFSAEVEDGTPVTVTLDERVQLAADEALADQDEFPTSLVAIRVSDGHVLAVANGPAAGGLDLALQGRYAPGSTFKVVTTGALLERGLDVEEQVSCPATTTVDGRSFRNAEDAELGDVPFRTVFAQSCNTAFVDLAGVLAPEDLRDTAAAFGLGHEGQLGVDVFTGDVPVTEGGTDQAAASIGQGRILVSPFAMADVAASAARGAALAPTLVVDDEVAAEPAPLPAEAAEALPGLMREVVTAGSGSAVADVPGEPVHGKTGTAEYGSGDELGTHAWFIGWQGDIAFAVLVAETPDAFGGRVAAPIAADFLTRLAES